MKNSANGTRELKSTISVIGGSIILMKKRAYDGFSLIKETETDDLKDP